MVRPKLMAVGAEFLCERRTPTAFFCILLPTAAVLFDTIVQHFLLLCTGTSVLLSAALPCHRSLLCCSTISVPTSRYILAQLEVKNILAEFKHKHFINSANRKNEV